MSEYLRREAFWQLVENLDFPIEYAGMTILGVKKRRAEQVHAELVNATDPWLWFLRNPLAGFKSGKIGRGRETASCPIADLFFTILAGGSESVQDLRVKAFGGRSVFTLEEACEGLTFTQREVIEYTVYNFLFKKPVKKGG